jgi:hypothetical protein
MRQNFQDYVPFDDWTLVFACLENGKAIDVPRVREQVERMKYDLSEKDLTIKTLNEEWKSRCDYLEELSNVKRQKTLQDVRDMLFLEHRKELGMIVGGTETERAVTKIFAQFIKRVEAME